MKIEKTIKVLLVEDHDSVSFGVIRHLQEYEGVDFDISSVNNVSAAQENLKATLFDVVLLDLILTDKDTVSPLRDGDFLLREMNKMKHRPKVIIYSKTDSLEMLDYVILNLKADGFILKSRHSLKEIVLAIHTVIEGDQFFSASIEKTLRYYESLLDLNYMDRAFLKALSEGIKQTEMQTYFASKGRKISLSGIEKRIKKLKVKFDSETLSELIAKAIKKGII